ARLVVFLFMILVYLGMIFAAIGNSPGLAGGLALLFTLGFFFLAPVLGVAGSALSIGVPGESGARLFIIFALVLDALIPLLFLIAVLAAVASPASLAAGVAAGMLVVILLSLMAFLAGWVFFMVFMKVLGDYLGEEHLGNESVRLIIKGVIILVAIIFVQVILIVLALKGLPPILVILLALSAFITEIVV